MSDLVPDAVSESPRLEWMRRNGIVLGLDKTPRTIDGEEVARPVLCCHTIVVHAKTEDDALWEMARRMGIKHYSQEQHMRAQQPVWE